MLRAIGLGVALFSLWLALSGHYTPLILSFGVVSTVLIVYLSLRMDVVDADGAPHHVIPQMLLYIPWLLKEIFVANFEVAKVILAPKLEISPRLITFHGSQKTELGRALFASSITLTPGTITTGVYGNDFRIHALRAADLETDEEREMDRRCTHVEGG